MSDVVVCVRGLSKSYGSAPAVRDVSFEVRQGEIFALLGPNGSGKTTTLESLEGLRRPDGGSMSVGGLDPARQARRLRNIIGVQLQTSALPASMTVEEALLFFSSYHGVPARFELVERLGLAEKRKTQYGRLSVGQQRRLALAIAIAHEPRVLFLDEPTAGLDVQSRADLHVLVSGLKARGTTVILASHDMAEVEKLADRAAILLQGSIAAQGSPRQLTAAGNHRTRVSVCTENGSLAARPVDFPEAVHAGGAEGYVVYRSANPGKTVAAILSWLESAGDPLMDLRVERPTLEERFLEITGGSTSARNGRLS
jgi:ABC-2 type transport system ATP-binding protein